MSEYRLNLVDVFDFEEWINHRNEFSYALDGTKKHWSTNMAALKSDYVNIIRNLYGV